MSLNWTSGQDEHPPVKKSSSGLEVRISSGFVIPLQFATGGMLKRTLWIFKLTHYPAIHIIATWLPNVLRFEPVQSGPALAPEHLGSRVERGVP